MKSDQPIQDINLIIIEAISPAIDAGRFSVKAIQEEIIRVEADILGFGKQAVAARIMYKKEFDNTWQESYMKCVGNDRWGGEFTVSSTGGYVYKIEAWVDDAATWQKMVATQLRANESIAELIAGGIAILSRMYELASPADGKLMKEALRMFGDEKRQEEAAQMAVSFRFTEWSNRYPTRDHATRTREIRIRVYRKNISFSAWYTLYPRSASSLADTHGTFRDVIGLLPGIKDAGFDVIHFPPIHPIGNTSKKGKNGVMDVAGNVPGSIYAIGSSEGGHESVHPELGSVEDFKGLITECESLGIRVAMDLSLHFSPDHPWVREHAEWFDTKISQKNVRVGLAAADSLGLAVTASNWLETQDAVVEIIKLWAERGISIFRADRPDEQPLAWWRQIVERITAVDQDLVFYAGTFARPRIVNYLAKSGFAISDSYFMWKNNRYELEQYIRELTTSPLKDYYKPIFWTNTHQINPYNLQSGHEPQHLIRFFLAATLASCYGIYGPVFEHIVHEPFPGKEDYWDSEQYEIKTWDWKKETKLTYLMSLINRVRRENEALQFTNNIHICESGNQDIMCYLKVSYQNRILCVVNLDSHHRQSGMVGFSCALVGKSHDEQFVVHDLITGARYIWKGDCNYVELDPYIMPFHLFRIEDYREELDGR
jgi:starch synthase (maltosyl-transferring)